MTKILVPLDGSEFSDRILDHVTGLLGEAAGGETTLLHVAAEAPQGQDRAALRAHLEAVRVRLERTTGARVRLLERRGDPVDAILRAILDERPDLVAMCSHGRGPLGRLLLGSVSADVLQAAAAPVLVVTPRSAGEPRPLRRLLVPLDGSEDAGRVLPLVEALARPRGAEVVLARVEWEGLSRPLLASTLSTEHLLEGLRPWAARLARAGVRVRCVAEHGDIARGLVAVADREDVDLIAMTLHQHGRLAGLLEGTVTERVLSRAHRPLLVVHV